MKLPSYVTYTIKIIFFPINADKLDCFVNEIKFLDILKGVDLCALVSTGVGVWKVCVTGQIYLSAWANIGIRWIKTDPSLPNSQLGGLELYMNGALIGVSMLPLQQTVDGTTLFTQVKIVQTFLGSSKC